MGSTFGGPWFWGVRRKGALQPRHQEGRIRFEATAPSNGGPVRPFQSRVQCFNRFQKDGRPTKPNSDETAELVVPQSGSKGLPLGGVLGPPWDVCFCGCLTADAILKACLMLRVVIIPLAWVFSKGLLHGGIMVLIPPFLVS